MKKTTRFFLVLLCVSLFACSKTEVAPDQGITDSALEKITQLGFSTKDAMKVDGGYVVEGDIFLSEDDLHAAPLTVRIPKVEQYHTFNTVSVSGTRTITVSIANKLPKSYGAALDEAIRRYNAENLSIRFQRVNSQANISIVAAPTFAAYLASAGFPTSAGDPYNQVLVNARQIGSNAATNYVATILAHEMGHCIGFRHTDWFDRSISCGGSTSNEGQQTTGVGAVHIDGTPTGTSPGSWMLACIGSGQDRPFNTDDKVALGFLY